MKPETPLTADVDRQLTLLRLAARVDPNLRQAVADVEDTIAALRTQLEQAQRELEVTQHQLIGRGGIITDQSLALKKEHEAYRKLVARETALRDALVRAKDALNWRDNKIRLRHRDPLGEAEIRALGERVGYGVLMSTASRLWYEKAGGGAFAVGDCLSTVEAADEAAGRALSGEGR